MVGTGMGRPCNCGARYSTFAASSDDGRHASWCQSRGGEVVYLPVSVSEPCTKCEKERSLRRELERRIVVLERQLRRH
jgi:hypothetical protein